MSFVIPIYLILDASGSMGPYISALDNCVGKIFRDVVADPHLSSLVRISVIEFSDDARVVFQLSEVHELLQHRSPLQIGGGTAWGPPLMLLHRTFQDDLRNLKSQGFRVYRPIAVFFTDGRPLDRGWGGQLDSMNDNPSHPTIIAVGMGDVDPESLRRLASRSDLALLSEPNTSPFEAISEFGELITSLLRSFASSSGIGVDRWKLPKGKVYSAIPSVFFE